MKHHHYRVRRKAARRNGTPSLFAWVILIAAWTAAAVFAVTLIGPVSEAKAEEAEPVPAFSEQSVTLPSLDVSLKASMRYTLPVRSLRSDKPTVLIYHTHTTEAYTQTETDRYRESSEWRSFLPSMPNSEP